MSDPMKPKLSALTCFAAEGARVGLTTCSECGCVLIIDPRDQYDTMAIHKEWHTQVKS